MPSIATNDAIYLHMEHPTNLMYVTGVLICDTPPDTERLLAILQERLLKFGRFQQKAIQHRWSLSNYRWADDAAFDIRAHLTREALPAETSQSSLQSIIGDHLSTSLDMTRPLWDVRIFDGYNGGSAVVVRIHHSVGDGLALVFVLLNVMQAADPNKTALDTMPRILKGGGKKPSLSKKMGDGAALLAKVIPTAKHMLSLSPDHPTILKGDLGIAKRAAWSEQISLKAIKAVGDSAEATINDVALTMLTGSLRNYLAQRGEPVDEFEIRVTVPVGMRPPSKMAALGNQIGAVTLTLPTGEPNPLQRLNILKQRMDAIKVSPEAVIAYVAARFIGMLPDRWSSAILKDSKQKSSALVSNVPGPTEALYLADVKVNEIMFWGPLSGRLSLGASILSYNGQVTLGVFSDAGLIPDPELILAGFSAELDVLRNALHP